MWAKFLFLLLIMASVSNCGVNNRSVNSSTEWNHTEEKAVLLKSGRVEADIFCIEKETDTIVSSINYMYYPNADSLYKDTVNYIISDFVQALTIFKPDSLITNISNDFFQCYIDSFAAIYNSSCADELGVWEADMTITIDDSFKEFIQLSIDQSMYTGGAHGIAYSATIPVDRKTGVVLELNDYFTDLEAVSKITDPYFRKVADVDENENLTNAGFWFHHDEFEINNNFTFSKDSVSFFYNSYEIAPYAAGVFEVIVPLHEIETFLKRPIR